MIAQLHKAYAECIELLQKDPPVDPIDYGDLLEIGGALATLLRYAESADSTPVPASLRS